jgi:hypothetical protein
LIKGIGPGRLKEAIGKVKRKVNTFASWMGLGLWNIVDPTHLEFKSLRQEAVVFLLRSSYCEHVLPEVISALLGMPYVNASTMAVKG